MSSTPNPISPAVENRHRPQSRSYAARIQAMESQNKKTPKTESNNPQMPRAATPDISRPPKHKRVSSHAAPKLNKKSEREELSRMQWQSSITSLQRRLALRNEKYKKLEEKYLQLSEKFRMTENAYEAQIQRMYNNPQTLNLKNRAVKDLADVRMKILAIETTLKDDI